MRSLAVFVASVLIGAPLALSPVLSFLAPDELSCSSSGVSRFVSERESERERERESERKREKETASW